MFLKFDKDSKGGLYWSELVCMAKSQRSSLDFFGWLAVCTEWGFTWLLCGDNEKQMMHKDDIRKMFDGTLFYELAEGYESGKYPSPNKGITPWRVIMNLPSTLRDIWSIQPAN